LSLAKLEPIVNETRRGQIVRHLRTLIVNGSVAPGERLTEVKLAKQLGVSRAPLREAICELVDSGLVVSVPYKGLFVRKVTQRDLEELYSLRTTLEQFAFRQCWDNRSLEAKEEIYSRHDALKTVIARGGDPETAIELELYLHSWCYELSDHVLLQKAWQQIKPNLQFYFTLHQKAHNRTGPMRDAHDLYVACATGDDLNAMTNHLTDHMRQGLKQTLAVVIME
jgi:DNA-binding GntR family transcriptional regulator|tara:strand:- start:38 stop:709 length:672 start_codon:yes stop_codon:yes gene_type:complete